MKFSNSRNQLYSLHSYVVTRNKILNNGNTSKFFLENSLLFSLCLQAYEQSYEHEAFLPFFPSQYRTQYKFRHRFSDTFKCKNTRISEIFKCKDVHYLIQKIRYYINTIHTNVWVQTVRTSCN
jgi:hypothetical protein